MEQIRSFIAIELPDELRRALDDIEKKLQAGGRFRARWVRTEGIHLTLRFLGDVSEDRIEMIGRALETAGAGMRPFHLEAAGLGAFPNLRRLRVVWAGLKGETDRLLALHRNIEQALEPLGFPPEGRSFSPHLTLARMMDNTSPEERRLFGKHIESLDFGPFGFDVRYVSLMRSRLMPGGAVYSRLFSTGLQG